MAVTATEREIAPANNSPLIVADPTDARFVVLANRLDAPDFSCALHVSGDGGRSWLPARGPALPAGAEKCYAPEAAFDRDGTLYYLFVGLAGAGNRPMGAFLTTSADRGRTFSAPRRVLGPLSFGVRMAIDPGRGARGRLHLVWLKAVSEVGLGGFGPPPNPIMTTHSDDGGTTFSPPVQVSDARRNLVVAPALTLGPDHAVHVAYYDLGSDTRDYYALEGPVWDDTWSVVVATSTDGGNRFSRGSVADSSVVPPERVMTPFTMPAPSLVAGAGGRVCVAWTDARHGDPDAMARCSPDRGRRWGPLRRLNDDRVGNGTRQYLPRLGLAPGGRLDAVFLDRRGDRANASNDVYYTFSADGGRRFAPNLRVTREPSDAGIGQRYAVPSAGDQVEFGARLGLLSRRDGLMAAWPDTRNAVSPGNSDLAATTGQDIVLTDVTLPSRANGAGRIPAGLVSVSLLGACTCVGLVVTRRRRRAGPDADSPRGLGKQGDGDPEDGRRRRRRLAAGGVLAVVAVAGLVVGTRPSTSARAHAPLPRGPQTVAVSMSEYRFAFDPVVAPGRVVFEVRNAGREDHKIGVYPLPEDMPPIDAQLHGSENRIVTAVAKPPTRRSGQTQTFALDLVAGQRYALLCFLNTADDELHALKGMNGEFRPTGSTTAPQTSAPARPLGTP